MRFRYLLAIFALVCLPGASKLNVLSVEYPEIIEIEAGNTATAVLKFKVASGFHVQANPASDKYLIPTTLDVQPAHGIVPGKPVYPKGKPYRLEGSAEDLSTYDGTFEVPLPLSVDGSTSAGSYVLTGKMRYQACDDRRCLAPTSLPMEIKVEVLKK